MHGADPGDDWREGTHNRHEARDHDDLAAMLFVEAFRLVQIFLLKKQ